MFNAVIFDIDGTLVDSVDLHARAWQEAIKRFGKDASVDALRQQIGKGGDQLLPVFFGAEELSRIGKPLAEFRRELYKREYLPRVRPFVGVRELVQRIQRDGMQVALASSSHADELQYCRRLAGLDDLDLTIVSGDDVESSKPEPDIFALSLRRLGQLRPNSVTVIGDSPYDVQAARGAHLQTLAVLCGGYSESQLRDEGAVDVYRDPQDLLNRYEQWAHRDRPYELARQ